ncbi:signal transduction histidine kinase [Nocardioides zeae]|uniref:Signal transduction histidine kinase n=2 Tax=Nocardioides zeae TaxID=1457234 RepID=A0ACC6IK99_9ACTN|nr:HAMP domain-containing sensor histidine kinase [Nocardioides zeae]MDQ1104949.1 signal transduction histidine kinase [Nocardioides zeae]MDR6175337.1 signal transduction histidine kinase [Nocardioides zeae]MDR6211171.1 signal transduction histidine kinase [Nocardioides zeae]
MRAESRWAALDRSAWVLAVVAVLLLAVGRWAVGSGVYGVNPIWLSVGIGTAVLALARGLWRVLGLVAIPTYIAVSAVLVGSPVLEACLIAAAGATAAVVAAGVLRAGGVRSIDSVRAHNVLAVAAVAAGAFVALVTVLVAETGGMDVRSAAVVGLGNAVAIFVWCPLLLERSHRRYTRFSGAELAAQVATFAGLAAATSVLSGLDGAVVAALLLVTLSWAGLRFGMRVTSAELVVLSLLGLVVWIVGPPLQTPSLAIVHSSVDDLERSWAIAVFVSLAAAWAFPLALVGDQRRDAEQRAQREVRALEATRRRFVATTSHELRTPVTNVLGRLDLLREGDLGELTPAQQRVVETATRNAERLADLVDGIVVLAQLEDPSAYPCAPLDLEAVVCRAIAAEQARHVGDGSIVTLRTTVTVVTTLVGNEALLHSAVRHLVRNALTFARAEVTVEVTQADGVALVTVANDGVSIPEEEREQIFDRFFRGTHAHTQAIQGSGIGLAIVQAAAERHRGHVAVESGPGDGARFELHLRDAPLV